MSTQPTIVAIAGSLREHSVNRGVLRAIQGLLPENIRMEIANIEPLPYFNMDLEQDEPASVSAFKTQLSQADAIVIATPEFNSSLPGVLKNALDWASRPYGASVMAGKPVAIVGAGAFDGTANAQAHLRLILSRFGVAALEQPEVYIAKSWEKFDEQGNLQDEATLNQLRTLVDALLQQIGMQAIAGEEARCLSL